MKKAACATICVAVMAMACAGATRISHYAPNIVRVVKTADGGASVHPYKTVTAEPKDGACAESLRVEVADGVVAFYDAQGGVMLREKGDAVFTPWTTNGVEYIKAAQTWELETGEAVYGLGDNQLDRLDMRGWRGRLMPRNVGDGLAAWVSVKGYGVLWDNTSPVNYSDGSDGLTLESDAGGAVDYYFVLGGSIDGVVAGFRELTGDVTMFPRWAYGFWQSKERYKSQDEIVNVAKKYRELGIPLDGIIQDWQYWGNNYLWNAMEFMSENFREPKKMVDAIHAMNAKLAISVWQSFGTATKQYRELSEAGLLFPFETWPQSGIGHIWPPRLDYPSGARLYDNYSEDARAIYWRHLQRLRALGVDCWWMDSTDPDHIEKDGDLEYATSLGVPWRTVRSAYPISGVGAVYERMRKATNQRCFIFTRGASLGQQRYGAAVWSGDIDSSWEALRCQIPGGLNFSMTGNPNFNCDLGGFFAGRYKRSGGIASENWRELYVRWMQLGTFLPMMRSHGTELPREIYLYGKEGEPVYDALVAAVKMRYRLMPYIYTVAADAVLKRDSFMRPLVADFPADKTTWNITDEFLLGRQILVAPVLKAQYTSEDNKSEGKAKNVDYTAERKYTVYLPAGADWWDVEKGVKHEGGKRIEITTTLASQPMFAKAGSVLPLGPDVQFNGEKPWDELEIRVFPGADASFELYEDDFETYAYEKGEWSRIPFAWDDASRTLVIGERIGAFQGMATNRVFRIVLPGHAPRPVSYDGARIELSVHSSCCFGYKGV